MNAKEAFEKTKKAELPNDIKKAVEQAAGDGLYGIRIKKDKLTSQLKNQLAELGYWYTVPWWGPYAYIDWDFRGCEI